MPAIDWHYLWHRPQQLMMRLARLGHGVHFRNPGQTPGAAVEEVAPHLWVYRDFDKLPPEVARDAIYFVYFPAYAPWITPHKNRFIIYDCIDDDPVFAPYEEEMLKRADLVICVSESLQRKFANREGRFMLLPNGVDLVHYQNPGASIPGELQRIKNGRVVLGFTGAFYQGWVDMELIYKIAQSRPEWQIVIIGESYQWDFSGAPPNLIYMGSRSYQTLPGYVRGFDVGLIPFLDNQIARGADPVKLYEYSAAGIPVVSRNLPFVQRIKPPLVYTYDSVAECLCAIEQALRDSRTRGSENRRLRLNFAAAHTWDKTIHRLVKELSLLTWIEKAPVSQSLTN